MNGSETSDENPEPVKPAPEVTQDIPAKEMGVLEDIQGELKEPDRTEDVDPDDEELVKRNTVVRFAERHTSIPPEDREPSCLAEIENHIWLAENNPHRKNGSEGSRASNKFTQTFFKHMTNLPNRRVADIVNTRVNYNDKSLVFYCRSDELLP